MAARNGQMVFTGSSNSIVIWLLFSGNPVVKRKGETIEYLLNNQE